MDNATLKRVLAGVKPEDITGNIVIIGDEVRSAPAHWRTAAPPRCGWCCRNDYDCTCEGDKE